MQVSSWLICDGTAQWVPGLVKACFIMVALGQMGTDGAGPFIEMHTESQVSAVINGLADHEAVRSMHLGNLLRS